MADRITIEADIESLQAVVQRLGGVPNDWTISYDTPQPPEPKPSDSNPALFVRGPWHGTVHNIPPHLREYHVAIPDHHGLNPTVTYREQIFGSREAHYRVFTLDGRVDTRILGDLGIIDALASAAGLEVRRG